VWSGELVSGERGACERASLKNIFFQLFSQKIKWGNFFPKNVEGLLFIVSFLIHDRLPYNCGLGEISIFGIENYI